MASDTDLLEEILGVSLEGLKEIDKQLKTFAAAKADYHKDPSKPGALAKYNQASVTLNEYRKACRVAEALESAAVEGDGE
jgi:hypothetical protein